MLDRNYQPTVLVDTNHMPNEEWLKWRTTGIGGSDVAAIFGVSPWTTKRALYMAKIGLQKADMPNPFTLDFGHAVEPFVARWYQSEKEKRCSELSIALGIKIVDFRMTKDTFMYQHPLYPFMQANLDYRIAAIDENGNEHNGIFECKTTTYHTGPDKWSNNHVPYYYELQCRHYMAIMNVDFTVIACVWGNNILDYAARVIKRDMDDEEEIIEMEQEFWEDVQNRRPPAIDKAEGKKELESSRSYSIPAQIKAGTLTELQHPTKEVVDAAVAYHRAKQLQKALEAKLDATENELAAQKTILLEAMGNDPRVVFSYNGQKVVLSNKVVTSNRIDAALLREELPDIAEKYTKSSTHERFSAKILQ